MKMNAKKWAVLAGAVLLAAAGILAGRYLTTLRGSSVYASVNIEAVKTGPYGVEPDSSFTVTLDRSVDETALRAMLQPDPELEYALAGRGKRWTLTPAQPLAENAVYTFRIVDETGAVVRSYAFQTNSGLLVNTAYPRPGATWVELETGIELTFNTPVADLGASFQIEPAVAGSFTATENTVVFVPEEPLAPNSIYRITLGAGLTADNGMVLAEDYTLAFETIEDNPKGNRDQLTLYGSFDETFLPGDPVVLKMMRGEGMEGVQTTLSVHRYAATQDYAAELQKRAAFYKDRTGLKLEYEVKTQTLEPVTELTTVLTPGDRWWSTCWATLPEGLPEGCYVLTLRGESPSGTLQLVQKLVQVCNLAAYAQTADGDALVWLMDAEAGEPLSGARVQLQEMDGAEQRAGVTDEDGVLLLNTDEMENAWISVSDGGRLTYFAGLELTAVRNKWLSESYYSALYKDREIYQPTDKLQFWGVLRPRSGEKAPQAVYAVLSEGGEMTNALYKTRIEIGADGTFLGELSFTGLTRGWYSLMLTDGGEGIYWSGSAQIEEFTKPPLIITAKTDKSWYYAGDTVNFTFEATYFDGTPAAGGSLLLSGMAMPEIPPEAADLVSYDGEGSNRRESATITLDAQGRGSYALTLQDRNWSYWSPTTTYYEVQSADTQDGYQSTNGMIRVAPSRYTCEATNPEKGRLVVKTAQFNEARMNSALENAVPYSAAKSAFEEFSGPAVDLPVTVEFLETVEHKTPDGEFYDEINNKTVTRYRYDYEDVVLRTEETRTVNGRVELEFDPAWEEKQDRNYWVRVRYDGGLGGAAIEETHYFGARGGQTDDLKRYAFAPEGAESGFALGESIPLALYENNIKIQNDGRVLYSRIADGIGWAKITKESGATVEFAEDCMPNIALAGAYFDGRHLFEITPFEARYDYTERTLEVQVQAEREAYAPGEEAKLTVTLRDAQGKPVAGTACVGVVDESVFALRPQEVRLIEQLYGNLRSTGVRQKSSYLEYNLTTSDAEGGMGGGGADEGGALRSEFKDTALFQTVRVDESGTATVAFTLPDNVTKWRVTAAAVTPDGFAGDGIGSAVATLPFYVRAVVTDTYLTGDDVTLGALAVGTNLAQGGMVEYTAELLGADGTQIVQKAWQKIAGEQTYASFGKVPEGRYTVRIMATSNGDSDALELPVSVVKTSVTASVTEKLGLAELAAVQPERWPATVDIYDTRLETYMECLRVLSGRAGERTEILAAAYRARVAQSELLPEEERTEVQKDARLTAIQDYESGIKPLPNAEPDAALTTKLLLAAPQLVNADFARLYLQNVLKDPSATQDSRLMAYVGLAALHEPVMLDITRLLEDGALTDAQRLYLGAGLAALGDFEGAQAVYDAIAATRGKTAETRRWLEGADENERQLNTGAALLLCSITGHADAEGLANELCVLLQEKPREDANDLADLELLAYTRYFRFNLGEQASFSYVRDGKRETVDLGARGVKSLAMSAEAFAAADWKAGRGDVAASIRYSASAALPAVSPAGSAVTIKKLVTPMVGSLKAPGLARVDIMVSFSPDAPEGGYQMFDAIPSGMRWVSYGNGQTMLRDWQNQVDNEGQQVSGMIWLNRDTDGPQPLTEKANFDEVENPSTDDAAVPGVSDTAQMPTTVEPGTEEGMTHTITYYVGCSLPGAYVMESTYVTDAQGNLVAVSPRGSVEIG